MYSSQGDKKQKDDEKDDEVERQENVKQIDIIGEEPNCLPLPEKSYT